MPAYIIVLREEAIGDAEAFAAYQSKTRELRGDFQITPRVVYGKTEALEGDAPDGIVVLEFPTMEQARAWYDSPVYQEALPHRLKAARHRAFIVEGF